MSETQKSNLERFKDEYAMQLAAARANHPEEYGFPIDQLDVVITRMKNAIDRGTYNHDGRAFKGTCKRLGIKHTRTAIEQFIRS